MYRKYTKIYRDGGSGSPLFWWDGTYLTMDGGVEVVATVEGNYVYPNLGASGMPIATIDGNNVYAGMGQGSTLAVVDGDRGYDGCGGGSAVVMADRPDTVGIAAAMAMVCDRDDLRPADRRQDPETYAKNRVSARNDFWPNVSRDRVYDPDAPEDMSDEEYRELLKKRAGYGSDASGGDGGKRSGKKSGKKSSEGRSGSRDDGGTYNCSRCFLPGPVTVDVWCEFRWCVGVAAFVVGLIYVWLPGAWLCAAAVGAVIFAFAAVLHRRRIPEMLRREGKNQFVTKAYSRGFLGHDAGVLGGCWGLAGIFALIAMASSSAAPLPVAGFFFVAGIVLAAAAFLF